MKIVYKLFFVFIFVFVSGSSLILFSIFQLHRVSTLLEKDVPHSIQEIKENSLLDGLAVFIRYYDEVLTQSARNYAFTSDHKWKDRYNNIVPELDKIIKKAIEFGDTQDKVYFDQINASNLVLVALETKSLSLVDNKRPLEAVAILESQEYAKEKSIYEEGLRKYVEKRGKNYNQALEASTQTIDDVNNKARNVVKESSQFLVIFGLISLILVVLIALYIIRSVSIPLTQLLIATQKISNGDLSKRIAFSSRDEISQLAISFNEMVNKLQQSHQSLEQKVQDRTTELNKKMEKLEKMNKLMVGRELKMVEYKREIEELKKNQIKIKDS
jgi:methyl-accepting chemotaxis protein